MTHTEDFKQHWRTLWDRTENGAETACPDEWAQLVRLAARLTGTRGTGTGEQNHMTPPG